MDCHDVIVAIGFGESNNSYADGQEVSEFKDIC